MAEIIYKFAEDFEIPNSKVDEILLTGESTNEILRTGNFVKDGAEFSIDSTQIDNFIGNFNRRVLGTDPPVNFGHDRTGEAAGWIKELFTDPQKTKLFAVIKWTAAGLKAITDRTWRYLSAEFSNNFFDGSTGKQFGAVLAGAAVTNVPFLRHMPAVVGMSEKEVIELKQKEDPKKGDSEMSKEENISLADHNAAVKVLTEANQELKDKVQGLQKLADDAEKIKGANVKLSEELSSMKDEISKKEREAEFVKLLSEGKACEAQREAFMAKEMDKFIELAQPINIKGHGHSNEDDAKKDEDNFEKLSDSEKKMYDRYLSDSTTKEEYMKNRKIQIPVLVADDLVEEE